MGNVDHNAYPHVVTRMSAIVERETFYETFRSKELWS